MKPAHDYFSTPEQIPAEVAAILATFDESADPYKELQNTQTIKATANT